MTDARHDTVLLTEAVESLDVHPADVVIDATVGGAGHFRALLAHLGPAGVLIGIDADAAALARAQAAVDLIDVSKRPRVILIQDNFRTLGDILDCEELVPTKVLFDLGWSGFQLADGRGFSFRADEPLLMTYGEGAPTTAADLVNYLDEAPLADLIWALGEERFSRSIARAIVAAREEEPIASTKRLAEVIEAGVPAWYRHRRLHPATKTFQALRIAANDELGALREGLATTLGRLAHGGRVAVITFHSIEDRIVKGMLRDAAYAGAGTLVNRKPVVPTDAETTANPRARSAKLRVFERTLAAGAVLSAPVLSLYA